MISSTRVAAHYSQDSSVLASIKSSLDSLGITHPTPDDLSAVDEFHVGGVAATESLLAQLSIASTDKVLDIGCGIGGAARWVATRYKGATVVGVDLTPEYVETGNALNQMCGGACAENIQLIEGSATDLASCLTATGNTFDKAFMLHVGMNIADKQKLMADIAVQLKVGGQLAVYDIMRVGENKHQALEYPVPWAADETMDFSCADDDYRAAAADAGLSLIAERNCHDTALVFFDQMKAAREKAAAKAAATTTTAASAATTAPPLGLNILMGADFPVKMGNIVGNIKKGKIAPYEMVFEKMTGMDSSNM